MPLFQLTARFSATVEPIDARVLMVLLRQSKNLVRSVDTAQWNRAFCSRLLKRSGARSQTMENEARRGVP